MTLGQEELRLNTDLSSQAVKEAQLKVDQGMKRGFSVTKNTVWLSLFISSEGKWEYTNGKHDELRTFKSLTQLLQDLSKEKAEHDARKFISMYMKTLL